MSITSVHDALGGAHLAQVAFVVEDLDRAVRAYADGMGIGPWTAYELDGNILKERTLRGEAGHFTLRHALAWSGPVQIELLQPLEGESIWHEHLTRRGEGFHHYGFYVEDHPEVVRRLRHRGWVVTQSARGFGAEGDGAFTYFESPDLPATVEVIEAPKVRRQPAFVYEVGQGGAGSGGGRA